jgi:hypothetical protein
MALFFHSDEVDEFIPFTEAVAISESALRDLKTPAGVNAPRKRLNLHRDIAEGSFDTVLNIYAGGSAGYGRNRRAGGAPSKSDCRKYAKATSLQPRSNRACANL